LFTNKQALLPSAQTDQSQFNFSAGFRPKIEHVLSGAGLTVNWYQKQAPETGQCVITISNSGSSLVQLKDSITHSGASEF